MLEEMLNKNEKIEMQEDVDFYPGEGVGAALKSKSGAAVLTNERLFVVRRSNSIMTWLPILLVIPVVIIFDMDMITGAITGGIIGGVGFAILSKFFKGKLKENPDFSIKRDEIESFKSEQSIGSLYVLSMKSKDGSTWSIHTKQNEEWNKHLGK